LAATLAGCGGDDGDRGPSGKDAIVGDRTVAPEEVNPRITGVSISSPMKVDFQVTDERGLAVAGITEGPEFTVNKLVPGADGETNVWQTYIREDDQGTANAQAGAYSSGTLVGHGDGSYTFTFDKNLEDIAGVAYQPDLTHRVGIELRDVVVLGKEIPAGSNDVYDFQPSTGKTSGIMERTIVKQESCATCHGDEAFSMHGGPRKDVDYCVTCHQKGSEDAGTGHTIDFRVMIHKIHSGSSEATYCGYGCENFGSPASDFSDVALPQDVRNCTTCHDPSDPMTPQATNVNNRPTAQVCASCHENLPLNADGTGIEDPGKNVHPAGSQPNSNCVTCHSEGGNVEPVLASHTIEPQLWAGRFEYNIVDVTQTGEGQQPMVTFSITDPTNGDAAYDLVNDSEFTGSATSVNMDLAWPTSDYTNVSNAGGTDVTGGPPSRPVSIPLVSGDGTTATLGNGVTDNGDGTYTVATGVTIPQTSPGLGSGAVAIEGHTSGDFNSDGTYDEEVPVTSAVEFFAINDSRPMARRMVVDSGKCQNCHGKNDGLAFHGGNRTDNTQICVVCHNPNQTDLFMRPADSDGFNGVNTNAVDNLEDRPIDFKYMIHAIHGSEARNNGYVAYGYGVQPHDYSDVLFPRESSDCLACHEEGTYELPLGSNVLATTLSSGATVTATVTGFANPGATDFAGAGGANDGSESDPTDDNNASATAAVCSACHDSAGAVDHMDRTGTGGQSFGDAFVLADPNYPASTGDADAHTQAVIDGALPGGENCAFCHGPGGIADVAEVHGVE